LRGVISKTYLDIPDNLGHKAMRAVVGAFLKLSPVKRALMSDTLRSRFLAAAASQEGLSRLLS